MFILIELIGRTGLISVGRVEVSFFSAKLETPAGSFCLFNTLTGHKEFIRQGRHGKLNDR